MAKYNKAKARAIAEFLAIAVGLGIFAGSQFPATGRHAKISPEDLRAFQKYAADVNEVVTELRKKGLPVIDDFKDSKMAESPAGERISIFVDLKKDPNSIYRSPRSRMRGNKKGKFYWGISGFLEQHPKAVSEKITQRIKALNNRYDKELKPILNKYDRKLKASCTRKKITFGTAAGLAAASSWQLGRKGRKKRKLRRRQRR